VGVATRLGALVIDEQAVVGGQGVGRDGALPADGLPVVVVAEREEVEGVIPFLRRRVDVHRVAVVPEHEDLTANRVELHEEPVGVHLAFAGGSLHGAGLHPREHDQQPGAVGAHVVAGQERQPEVPGNGEQQIRAALPPARELRRRQVHALIGEVTAQAVERQEQPHLGEAEPGHQRHRARGPVKGHRRQLGGGPAEAVLAAADHPLGAPHPKMRADVVQLLRHEGLLVFEIRTATVPACRGRLGFGAPLEVGWQRLATVNRTVRRRSGLCRGGGRLGALRRGSRCLSGTLRLRGSLRLCGSLQLGELGELGSALLVAIP